jgi:hypothetical protein
MRDTAVRLYEVVRAGRGRGVSLRDVLTGASFSPRGMVLAGVTENVQLVAARIVPRGASGQPEFHGAILTFTGHARIELTALLRDELAARRRDDLDSERDEHKALAPVLYRRWCALTFPDQSTPTMPTTDAARREALEVELHAQYAGWIDAPNEALAGASPRAAASSPDLCSCLVELLRGLEREYGRRLALDEPAFDPSLLWDDLGLRVLRDGPRDRPPPLGHETMAALLAWQRGRRGDRRGAPRAWSPGPSSSATRRAGTSHGCSPRPDTSTSCSRSPAPSRRASSRRRPRASRRSGRFTARTTAHSRRPQAR